MRLWDWALAAYVRPGVAEACLALQDQHQQNVPYLLWAAWSRISDPQTLAQAARAARRWETRAVAPLRAARRNLKRFAPPVDDARREALRERVRAAELAAERLLLEALEVTARPRRPGVSILEALRGAAIAWSGEAPDDALRGLAAALDPGLPLEGVPRHDQGPNQGATQTMDEQDAEWERDLRSRLTALIQEHADLDVAIGALTNLPMPDMMVIARLKRKKLALKDEISRLQDQLTPDIIA